MPNNAGEETQGEYEQKAQATPGTLNNDNQETEVQEEVDNGSQENGVEKEPNT